MTGFELREWRDRLHISGKRAAEKLGVSEPTYWRWEQMEKDLPAYVGRACAAITLGVSEPSLGTVADGIEPKKGSRR